MDLWLVLVVFGNVGGSWGPLPYDMAECQSRSADMIADIRAGMAEHPDVLLKGRTPTPADISAHCIEADDRPVLGSAFPS